jgi:AraC family transcriptional activator of pobA
MIEKVTVPGPIELDRLLGATAPAQVMRMDGPWTHDAADAPREPHRHDYHELFLVRAGSTLHRIDGEPVLVGAGQALLIGRGQVHELRRADAFEGVVVRFGDELLTGAAQEASPGWMLVACGTRVLDPPASELGHAIAAAHLLEDELRRPPDAGTDQLVASSLATMLSLVERWQAASNIEPLAGGSSPDIELLRGFVRLLEAEYHQHHDAGWYASQLAVTPNHLAATLTKLTGRSTKRLVTDRVMIEVTRLLRFTDLTVQQVAQRVGYDDPLYLSRAFKTHAGVSPSAWRERRSGA